MVGAAVPAVARGVFVLLLSIAASVSSFVCSSSCGRLASRLLLAVDCEEVLINSLPHSSSPSAATVRPPADAHDVTLHALSCIRDLRDVSGDVSSEKEYWRSQSLRFRRHDVGDILA